MTSRFKILGYVLMVIGVGFLAGGGIAYVMTQDGYGSLQSFSQAQGVEVNYNEDGQLVDRGSTETAQEIMTLLTDDWGYPVDTAELDPNDPLVNTDSEYMWQMAVVGYHVLHGSTTVTLEETVEYNGETFEAGTYEVAADGRYWTDWDRSHPLEGPARGQIWTGTVHGLFGELGVGTVTHSALQLALSLSAILAGLGLTFMVAGGGLVWAVSGKDEYQRLMETTPERRRKVEV